MPAPADPKIFHIVHLDRLQSIIADGGLLCDAAVAERAPVGTTIGMNWRLCKEGKQAEFLIERRFPWELVSRIGVRSRRIGYQTEAVLEAAAHRPPVEIRPAWYY